MRVQSLLPALATIALLGAVPAPSPAPTASPSTLSVVCARAPFYVFASGANIPVRGRIPAATMGERFALVSGPRTTLSSFEYYETNVAVVEPGYPPGAHYWISRDCAIPS